MLSSIFIAMLLRIFAAMLSSIVYDRSWRGSKDAK